jgi:cytochrome P450
MSQDSTYYSHPQEFNGFRFFRPEKRNIGSVNTQQDYTGIKPGNLSWGNGRFTCPGRWYAAAMIKLIVAKLLLDYEFEFPEGQRDRPGNLKYDTEVHPDFGQESQDIVLRKRNGG